MDNMKFKRCPWRLLSTLEHHFRISNICSRNANAIVNYHSVSDEQIALFGNISPMRFQRDIEFFDTYFEIVDLPEVIEDSHTGTKKIAITFDDGYQNFFTNAWPILNEWNAPATLFINPSFIGGENKAEIINAHSLSTVYSDMMLNHEQIATLAETDLISIGNHTSTHANLTTLSDPEAIETEICGGKDEIETEFGIPVNRFSYPYGSHSDAAIETVRQSHKYGVGTNSGILSGAVDRHRLPRIGGHNPERIVRWEVTELSQKIRGYYKRTLF